MRSGVGRRRRASSAGAACGRAARIASSIRSGGISWPCAAPAAREIDSFISVPPRSFAPARSAACAPSIPSFTHEACTFVIQGCSASRPTACMSSASRNVGPGRARPLR